jgi:diguanylate cyclase (GGDEF)-like protein
MVMIDIDLFKQVNDAYGHQAGDRILQELGNILQEHTRREDMACRLGGDEFVVMLSNTPLDVAETRAETWCQAFLDLQVRQGDRPLYATLSAGIAGFPEHGTDGTTLLQSADQALYQAKAEGRNRVSVLRQPDRTSIVH